MILSFHGINHRPYSLHSVLHHHTFDVSSSQWKTIVLTALCGIKYLHDKTIIHNDIKEDNIMIQMSGSNIESIIIDFGKACLEANGRLYNLSSTEKVEYKIKHPHLAPDVRDSLRCQDKLSDIYSFGRILLLISEEKLNIPAMISLSLSYKAPKRPSTSELYTFLTNMLN